jgi:ubiquinone/menaquinone biosynthesis C-methylase UbiE
MTLMEVNPEVYSTDYYETECGGWEDWHKTHGKEVEPRLTYTLHLARVKKNMHILDFGCGRGEVVYQAAQRGAHAVGIDYSADAIKLARKLPKTTTGSMTFIHTTSLSIPLADHSQDRIFYLDVLEHMYPEQLEKLLPEFKRVLKPHGKIILHTAPNRDFFDYGYPYFTRPISILLNPLYRVIFHESLNTRQDPRRPYDHLVHINESTLNECENYFSAAGFGTIKLWYSSQFRDIRKRDHVRYILLQPQLSFLRRWFCYDIWGIISP